MSLLQIDEAQAAGIGVGVDEAALQDAIDEEEAWLARRIGPLTGERTERLALVYVLPGRTGVRLKRPTNAVEVTQDGVELATVELQGEGWILANLPEGTRYSGVLELTYTPNDELEVKRALKELLGLTLSDQGSAGLTGETIGTYSYQRAAGVSRKIRKLIVRELSQPGGASSSRLRPGSGHGLAGALGR